VISGLSEEETKIRIEKYGFNELTGKEAEIILECVFLNQFKSFMIIVLIIAAIISGSSRCHGRRRFA
jgi:Ca2+-transporting ATPase